MKRLNVALFLCLYLSITGFCQDMEIPEEIITGFDRTLYKTPLFFYQYPIEPAFPEIKSPNSSRQIIEQSGPDEVIKGQQIFSQFSLIGGKFNQISSDLLVKNKETNMHLSLLNDDSFRSNDNKRIIDASFEKQLTDHILFDVGYRNSRKEMPGPTYRPFDRKKYTTLFKSGFLFSNQDYTIGINGIYNTLEELEEKQESFIFKKYYEKFIFKTEIGHNEFGGKENTIFDLSACKDDQNYQIGLAIKTIGDQTRLLPEAMITMGKGDVSLSAGIVSDFSFPDLWIKAGDSSYLTMENVFLLPEEKYRIYSMLNFNIADTQIGFNGQVSYEKTSYQWRDMDNDNLYEPCMIKDNIITDYGIDITKKMGNVYIKAGFNHQIWQKKLSGFPKENGYIRWGFENGKFNPEIQVEYTGKQNFDARRIGGYTLISALFSYQIHPDMAVFCKFNNIFENEYHQAPGYPGRPFEALAGFHIRW